MKYQPNQELSDYETSDLVTSSVITGDFTTDSLKYGFGPTSGNAAESEHRYGVAVLENPKVSGTVHFEDTGEGLKIDYEIVGLYNGLHGFHIHEYGDLTDGCTSACAHFNPDNETHGGLDTETRHMGDLGNISSENRVSKGSLFLPQAKLDSSKYGVLGRMVIVHADEDDLGKGGDEESLKTGNAGKRLACGIIGLAEPPQKLSAESSDESKLREYERTYGKAQAKIRMRLKKKIMSQAIMGTKAGEWSARKSQELKRQYEAACEKAGLKPYKGPKTKSQDNLSDWSKQNWKTASGKKSSKTGEPYFPAKAVAELKKKNLYSKAIRQKKAATQAGKQHARYSDDIRAVVKKYRSEEVFAAEPWDSGERFNLSPRDLEREIADGLHTNSFGNLGCPSCGNIDYFWKSTTSKGTKYRCMMCEYTEDYETVKSQGDITLEKFGLTVECPICEESISAYNQDSINRHLRKHEKEAAEASEPKVSEAEWDMTINWNSRCPKCGKSADNPIRTKEYDGYVRTTYYCDCDVGQPDPDFENRFIREYLRWFGSSDPNQVLYGHTTVSPPCMGHHDLFPGESDFIGYDIEEIAQLEDYLERRHGLRVTLPRPEPEQTLGPNDIWLEVYSKPGEKPLSPRGDAGETTCSKCVEKLMSGATYSRGYRPKRMIRWSDWKNDDWDKTVELPTVLEAEDSESDDYALIVGDLSDTEQLSLEIEDIDETYGLLNLSEIETSVQEFAVNAASEMMEDYSDIMPCVAIVFVSDSFSAHHVARYRGQTVGNCPIVMLSLSAIKNSAAEYDVPLNLAVATSVWHELGHALDEYCLDYLNFDVVKDDDPEEFAESFARWYSGFSNLAPLSQEELLELSED